MGEAIWYCTRQRAGPLVKECRALRPRLGPTDTRADERVKRELRRGACSAVSRTQVDRLELRLALLGYEGSHYTLTYDDEHLPARHRELDLSRQAFLRRLKRWRDGRPFDWISAMEGKHGDHRYHIHLILRDSEFSPAEVRYLWRQGGVDDEPVLLKTGGYRRLAEYLNKERPDGFVIPIGKHPWGCSRSLSAALPQTEIWKDSSGLIYIPDDVLWARRGGTENDFGAYYYGSYILSKPDIPIARTRAGAFNLEI